MHEIISSQAMRAAEQAAIARGDVTGLALMERAGVETVAAILELWPELTNGVRRAVVLAGPGNNGGDGFVVARLLAERGWVVTVMFYGRAEGLPPDARRNYDRWRGIGRVEELSFPEVSQTDVQRLEETAYHSKQTDLIVDALFGIGLTRPITGLAPLLAYNDIEVGVGERLTPARHLSIDIPSGMYADGGNAVGYCTWFLADATVTFHALKQAHVDPVTAPSCGRVVVRDIGI